MIIDAISDLHGNYPVLKGGDLLIIAGDLTARDTEKENNDFWRWLCYQNYKKCIVVGGNHDNYLQNNPDFIDDDQKILCHLLDSGTEFEGLKIWGTPWTKTFCGMNPNCKAFTCSTEAELKEKFDLIPGDIDILITHSPPYGYLDTVYHPGDVFNEINVGSTALLETLKIVMPKYLICGHIHEDNGYEEFHHNGKMTYIFNVSLIDEYYNPVHPLTKIKI